MDHRLQQRRSSYGGGFGRKTIGASSDPVSLQRADVDGNDQFRRRLNSSKIASDSYTGNGSSIEEKSFTWESRQSSFKSACGRSSKASVHDKMPREKETRRSSPSVIASLMGLDTLPPTQVLDKPQKNTRSYSQKTFADDVSPPMRKGEQQIKDVFEIKDTMKVEKQKIQPLSKRTPYSTRGETEVAYIKQKFMEAKRLSTDENLQNSKEFNDALEILDSNKDLFLQFLQEPNSSSISHLHDMKSFSPSPHESHITILKSSKGKKNEMGEASCSSEAKAESRAYLHKDVVGSCRKPITCLVGHSLKEHSDSLSHKLLKSRKANKTISRSHPTRIVVLNPSLEKVQNLGGIVPPTRSHENHPYGYRRHREVRQSEIQELHVEGREWQKLFNSVETMRHEMKGSREINQETEKQSKQSVGGLDRIQFSGSDKYAKDDSPYAMSYMYSSHNFEAYQRTPNFDYSSCSSSHSSSSSTSSESSVSKEARKRLSRRWRTAQQFQEARLVGRGSSTLGEMLAQSDRESGRDTSRATLMSNKIPDEKLASGLLGTRCYPSGISSRDGWKEGWSKNLSRSSSLPASSTVRSTPNVNSRQCVGATDRCYMLKDVLNLGANDSLPRKLNQRGSSSCSSFRSRTYKSHSLNSVGEENRLPVRVIHVNKEELRKETSLTNRFRKKPSLSKFSARTNFTSVNQYNRSSIESMGASDAKVSFVTDEEHVQQGRQDGEVSGDIHTDTDKDMEERSADKPQVDSLCNPHDGTNPEIHKILDEAEHPSPLSVLELPYEDKSSPESFDRVNAGLQGLQMQLQLLRLEKSDTHDEECEAPIPSEDDTDQKPELPQTFRNEEERDFSYLLDVLVDSGVHGAKQDRFFDACYSLESPVHPCIFEKLEKKYGAIEKWSRSERKPFFDLINSVLAEVLAPFMDLRPWVKPKQRNMLFQSHDRFSEEVWQMVVRLRKELSANDTEAKILDPKWIHFGDDVDMIGREVECMLKDDLIEELVSDLILGQFQNS